MGAGQAGAMIVKELRTNPQWGLEPVGFAMEANPAEAITTNVLGTRNLVAAALATGVEHFVVKIADLARSLIELSTPHEAGPETAQDTWLARCD